MLGFETDAMLFFQRPLSKYKRAQNVNPYNVNIAIT